MKLEQSPNIWWRAAQQASALLIFKGTAMASLIPWLLMVPFLLLAAVLCRDVPILAIPLLVTAIGMVCEYGRQFARFARDDPDRLQSEQHRFDMTALHMISAKDLPRPIPAERILPESTPNPAQPVTDAAEVERALEASPQRERDQ